MLDNFKLLSVQEEKELEYNELIDYYTKLRKYYKELPINKANIKVKEFLHPFLLKCVKMYFKDRIEIINAEELNNIDNPCIYVFNHSNGYDFPIAASVVEKHFHILADFTMKKDKLVDLANRINGVVYVDRKSKEDRQQSKNKLLSLLNNGKNIFIFPEGTWNLSPNLLMLPLNWGVIDIAKISGVPIVPAVIEYRENKIYVKIGKSIHINIDDDKKQKIDELTDTMATLKWDIIEKFHVEKRNSLKDNYYDIYLEQILSTYKKLDVDYEQSVILKKYPTYEEVFEPIKKLKINKNNAFLLNRNYKK